MPNCFWRIAASWNVSNLTSCLLNILVVNQGRLGSKHGMQNYVQCNICRKCYYSKWNWYRVQPAIAEPTACRMQMVRWYFIFDILLCTEERATLASHTQSCRPILACSMHVESKGRYLFLVRLPKLYPPIPEQLNMTFVVCTQLRICAQLRILNYSRSILHESIHPLCRLQPVL